LIIMQAGLIKPLPNFLHKCTTFMMSTNTFELLKDSRTPSSQTK
jgi:hypothetical protein